MHLSTSAISTILLFLTSLHPTTARVQIRTHTSPTTTSNSTALLACINQLHADLQANPRARAMPGYICGDSTFYYGTPGLGGATGESELYAVEKCEPNLTERAKEGMDWFECTVRAAWGERRVGWKELEKEKEEKEEQIEQEFEKVEKRDMTEGEEADEEEEEEGEEDLGLLKNAEQRDAELDGVEAEHDEVYEFDEAELEEGDWDDEIDGEE
ncbi:hypothetical protein CBER1_07177 [Cercospora berteroae]|uniref:Ecp2 effector protein domain-containing protein n=1 Tax=Cercospora berteroae TaxID=357750 RepID=A0A2S6BRX3_9PEZI|nr:hypothetical protein CBER1_07177 [Cercospora berteroae]